VPVVSEVIFSEFISSKAE